MPEQLTLNQAAGQGGAIHFDQSLAASGTEVVQRPCHQLFARAGFADDQHRRVGGGHGFNGLEHPGDRGALPDDLLEVVLALDFVLEIAVLLFQAGAQPSDLLVRQHVLDRERDLLTDLLEEPDILGRVLIRVELPRKSAPRVRSRAMSGTITYERIPPASSISSAASSRSASRFRLRSG